VWISYHLFSVAAAVGHDSNHGDGHSRYRYLNWSAGGCVLLCLLFQASGWLTEEISMSISIPRTANIGRGCRCTFRGYPPSDV
jgi:hypothetical protein